MKIKLGMDDVVNVGKDNKITVSELVPVKGEIFNLIKKGFEFDDEVLEKAHIKKIVRDEKINNIIVEHTPEKKKVYNKESESLKNILKSLNTIDKQNEDTFLSEYNTNQDTEETFLYEEE